MQPWCCMSSRQVHMAQPGNREGSGPALRKDLKRANMTCQPERARSTDSNVSIPHTIRATLASEPEDAQLSIARVPPPWPQGSKRPPSKFALSKTCRPRVPPQRNSCSKLFRSGSGHMFALVLYISRLLMHSCTCAPFRRSIPSIRQELVL